jgi:hypothetical protein
LKNFYRDIEVSFECIDSLNEDEKNDIDTIISKTDIDTRLRVPNTKRSRLEKDLHKFNVLRGSIISWEQFNRIAPKDFRLLLLHLTNENYISKKEKGKC